MGKGTILFFKDFKTKRLYWRSKEKKRRENDAEGEDFHQCRRQIFVFNAGSRPVVGLHEVTSGGLLF